MFIKLNCDEDADCIKLDFTCVDGGGGGGGNDGGGKNEVPDAGNGTCGGCGGGPNLWCEGIFNDWNVLLLLFIDDSSFVNKGDNCMRFTGGKNKSTEFFRLDIFISSFCSVNSGNENTEN